MNPRENIVNTFRELSAELQRAAEFSLQNTNQLVVLSMRAFAAEAGVKPATLLRLAQRLGYNGWGELKDAFIDELGLRNDT
ncbi:MurR/RpiR family transcriptional regulator, partial [Escherichia coli]|nr:DNA-binding protein [Escherichia coli]